MTNQRTVAEFQLGPTIRKRRTQMGLTLQALCDRAGLSVGYLSEVERGNSVPSLGTLAQIANGLEVGLEYFVTAPKPADALTRAAARPSFSVAGSPLMYEALSNDYPGSELSSYLLHVPPGHVSETFSHEGEEVVYVLDGTIDHTLAGETFRMGPGDSLHFSGSTPHSWSNPGDSPARVIWTGTLHVLRRDGAIPVPRANPTA